MFGVLKKIGLGIVKKEDLKQVCIKDSLIRTEMVDFKIDCNKADEVSSVASVVEQTSFIGNHEVIIDEYKYFNSYLSLEHSRHMYPDEFSTLNTTNIILKSM